MIIIEVRQNALMHTGCFVEVPNDERSSGLCGETHEEAGED